MSTATPEPMSSVKPYDSNDDSGDELFNEPSVLAAEPKPVFVTQPTQLIPSSPQTQRSSPSVQVAASSPSQFNTPRPESQNRGAFNSRLLALSMAPPGTVYRPPAHVPNKAPSQSTQPSQLFNSQQLIMSDDDPQAITESSEDELIPSADIKPSVFQKSKPAATSSQTRDDFKNLTAGFTYNGASSPNKRPGSTMADVYGDSRRPAKMIRQTGPARAQPVSISKTLDDIPDFQTKQKIEAMMIILPNQTVSSCEQALREARGNQADALSNLVTDIPSKKSQAVDLTGSDDDDDIPELQSVLTRVLNKPAAKRQVDAPSRSIREKYSTLQGTTRQPPKPSVVSSPVKEMPAVSDSTNPAPRRRRLVQGRRAPTSPAAPSSPVIVSAQTTRPKVVHVIESDDDDETDSGVGDEEEPNLERQNTLLQFINTCTTAGLIDLSGQPVENVESVLAKRPFDSLDQVREITVETKSTTKAGKQKTTKKAIGDRLLDACEDMWAGYEAVDELVEECAAMGKPIAEEMQKWGINVHGQSGELEMVELDNLSSHDSGIGTPTSTTHSVDDDDGVSIARSKKKSMLRQPQIMSSELTMKDYQVAGLNWLALLYSKNLSCILADDMGLGKTCQVISFLSHLYEIGAKGPHLIIVPGSTLENWLREFQNFSPNLRVEPYYGAKADRSGMQDFLQSEIEDINVIVTTYDTAAKPSDAHFLRHLHLNVCVYDEGHALKNSDSKRYKELMRIPAQFRLLLTGTPLQNNLQELISLLAFIMPNVFRSRQERLKSIFKHRAKTTDDSSHAALLSADRIKRARSMMTPFILRRKKHQVLKHLPTKTRRVEYCEMTANQKKLYDLEFARFRHDLLDEPDEAKSVSAAAKSKAKATAAAAKATTNIMMRLRQAAIHPLLLRHLFNDTILRKMSRDCVKEERFCESNPDLVFEDFQVFTDFGLHKFCLDSRQPGMAKYALKHEEWMDSGKVSALVALLLKHKDNGDRTLVFSQFTMVMDILEEVLETIDIPYVRLDGSTKMEERQGQIDLYHSDTSIQVFLLSTKAGGAGINLACANKVVIFDSSFNPQDDIQAENRAHRVGQKREVEVVRLVTRDTIEEQIHALGESKLTLDDRVAGVDAAAAKDDDTAEHEGEGLVEKMMREKVAVKEVIAVDDISDSAGVVDEEEICKGGDLKEDFLDGLKAAGVNVKTKKTKKTKK